MSVHKNKKNNTWYIKVRNKKTKKSTTIRINPRTNKNFTTKKEAKEYEAYYLKHQVNLSMTFDDLFNHYINDYLSTKPNSSANHLKSWYKSKIKDKIGKRKIQSITLTDLELLAKGMLEDDYSINYTNKMTTNIKTIMNYGVSHGYIDHNPIAGYKSIKVVKTTKKVQYWTPREFQMIIESIPKLYTSKKTDVEYIRLMLLFAYLTGARKGELRALKWEDIELYENRGIVHINHHISDENERVPGRKNGDGYALHLDETTLEVTKQIRDHFSKYESFDPNGYVFPSIMNGFDYPLGDHTATRWVEQLANFNKIKNITFHGLRHSNVCYLATEVKLTPYEVADRIGDTVQVVMEHYYQFFQEKQIEVANAISKHKNPHFNALVNKGVSNDTNVNHND